MARKHAPTITYARDPDGTRVARVPLANSPQTARLLPEDLAELSKNGASLFWTLNSDGGRAWAYVRAACSDVPGHLLSVARAIARATPGQAVKYRDGNPLNLRRDNLYVTSWPRATRELPPKWRLSGYQYRPSGKPGRKPPEAGTEARPM